MKCSHCGHESKQTYFDLLKLFLEGVIDDEDWTETVCGKNCPFYKNCKFPEHSKCFLGEFEEWLRKEVKPCKKKNIKQN